MSILFEIKRDGNKLSAAADGGAPFPVGQKVRFKNKKTISDFFGLSNDGGFFGRDYAETLLYEAKDYRDTFGFMADFIEPTAICEGQSFLSLNTYDRARFTFGFGQFAAHIPGGDFIRWFIDMLGRPEAPDYFPSLVASHGAILKIDGAQQTVLADSKTTVPLLDYLNPSLNDVEDSEVISAAKFIHWTVNHQGARLLQVQHMVETALGYVREADKRLGLDGAGADICCVLFDIRHQGRAGFDDMLAALKSAHPFENLLQVGKISEKGRVDNLTKALANRRAGLAAKTWSRRDGRFV